MNGKGRGASSLNRSRWHVRAFLLRRRHFVAAAVSIVLPHPVAALAQDTRWAAPDGAVILFRHANAPGVGDPSERNSPQTVFAMATLKQWKGPGVIVRLTA